MQEKITIQYLIGVGLALLIIPIVEGALAVLPNIGWHFLTVMYFTVFTLQITFYYLTTNFKFGWTVLSFILNFIFWTFEQVIIEKTFHDSIIYNGENWKLGVYILGGLLWVTNKILIDKLFDLNKSIHKQSSRINT
ncbi:MULTISPECIES: hypothetical protein [Sphingobacterium]|uniref:hypothetical protein n=1 Tax=Sphingobacterium TaxID=28453 RepID=UPI001043E72E|nr:MULTISPECIES: hypothetical protein [Sphingobacterium]MCW2263734.1 hypothetical protein [Sphingobacterium kitahiroshimense]TCR03790.1 hypothetical protein EDF67_1118 [Sphingobacterium sp. JUb78]